MKSLIWFLSSQTAPEKYCIYQLSMAPLATESCSHQGLCQTGQSLWCSPSNRSTRLWNRLSDSAKLWDLARRSREWGRWCWRSQSYLSLSLLLKGDSWKNLNRSLRWSCVFSWGLFGGSYSIVYRLCLECLECYFDSIVSTSSLCLCWSSFFQMLCWHLSALEFTPQRSWCSSILSCHCLKLC